MAKGSTDGVGAPCPYCGALAAHGGECGACGGRLDPLSRQATQNQMGPWFIRDESRPFAPGCSYPTLLALARKGRINAETVVRGPTTMQFWTLAGRAPGLAHHLGVCHSCREPAGPEDSSCGHCGASFGHAGERQHLGLGPVHVLPSGAKRARAAGPSPHESAPVEAHTRGAESGGAGADRSAGAAPRSGRSSTWVLGVVGIVLGAALAYGAIMVLNGEPGDDSIPSGPIVDSGAPPEENTAPMESSAEDAGANTLPTSDAAEPSPTAQGADTDPNADVGVNEEALRRFLERRAELLALRRAI